MLIKVCLCSPVYGLERRPSAQFNFPHFGVLKHHLGHGHQRQGLQQLPV